MKMANAEAITLPIEILFLRPRGRLGFARSTPAAEEMRNQNSRTLATRSRAQRLAVEE
jgi:hypothetical protein